MERRVDWIDGIRGVAILLVVLGHVLIRTCTYSFELHIIVFIYSFHMPLFFVISGINFKREDRICLFITKNIKKLVKPYCMFSILFMIAKSVIQYGSRGRIGIQEYYVYICEHIRDTLLLNSRSVFAMFWFFLVLFDAKLIIYLLLLIREELLRIAIILALVGINIIFNYYEVGVWPLGLCDSFLAVPFVYIGLKLRQYLLGEGKQRNSFKVKVTLYIVFLLALLVWEKGGYGVSDMYDSHIYNAILFFVLGITGSGAFICVLKGSKLVNCKWVRYIGQNSMFIFGLHYCFLEYLCAIIAPNTLINISHLNCMEKIFFDIVLLVIIVSCCLAINWGYSSVKAQKKRTVVDGKND